jgi:methylmalonyl-CoA/ethylmalonyl-CoA epimerase
VTKRPDLYLHHGCLSVADLDRSIEFYGRILGFEQESRRRLPDGGPEIAFLRRGADHLELVCHPGAESLPDFAADEKSNFRVIGTKHISFGTDDPRALHAFLQEQGVDGLSEIHDNNPFYYYFFFRDVDGINLEVVAPKE